MQVRGRVGLLLGGLVLVGLLASDVVAQGAPGRIVQASDGTLYLLKDGMRYAIVGEPVEVEELGAYTEGDAVGAALLLNGLPAAATAPQTAVVAPPPAAPVEATWDIEVRDYLSHDRVEFYVKRFTGPSRSTIVSWMQRGKSNSAK